LHQVLQLAELTGKHLPACHPPSTRTPPSEMLRSPLSRRMRHLAGRRGERGSPSVSINPLSPPPNALHEGCHHQPEQYRAANTSRRSASALSQPSACQIPPATRCRRRGRRTLWQLPRKIATKRPQPWGAKPPGPSDGLGVAHQVGTFRSG